MTAAGFAELGSDVYCVDLDASKIERLKRGEIPIYEPGLEEMVRRNRSEKRLEFTKDLPRSVRAARIVFIAVGTPQSAASDADLSSIWAVTDALAGIQRALACPGPVLTRVVVSYEGREMRWLKALRSQYIKKLPNRDKIRLAARVGVRVLHHEDDSD